MHQPRLIEIAVDRDSVCAGDDTEPHIATFQVASDITITELLDVIANANYLASIQGGEATWLVEAMAAAGARPLGIVAQQWPRPRLVVPTDTPLLDLLSPNGPHLYFRYLAQANPDTAFTRLVEVEGSR